MLAKYITTGLVGSALLASVAFAQSAGSDSSFQGTWRTSKVVGLNVYNDNNESIGSINDLLMEKTGGVKAAVISVGGFLGMGARLVAVPYDKIKFVNEPIAYTGVSGTPSTTGTRPASPGSSTTTGAAPNATSQPVTPAKPNPWYPDHAVFNTTKDELQKMPEFKYSE